MTLPVGCPDSTKDESIARADLQDPGGECLKPIEVRLGKAGFYPGARPGSLPIKRYKSVVEEIKTLLRFLSLHYCLTLMPPGGKEGNRMSRDIKAREYRSYSYWYLYYSTGVHRPCCVEHMALRVHV